jgi:hypothetical protein
MLRPLLLKSLVLAAAVLAPLASGCTPTTTAPPAAAPPVPPPVKATEETTELPADPADGESFALEEGFTLLTRNDFDAFGAEAGTWTSTPEGVRCSGMPRGYLYSKTPYGNFTLRLQYRFDRPKKLPDEARFKGNTGFLMYITGEHKLWPLSMEVQGKHVQMAAIKENGGAEPAVVDDDENARRSARRPVGHWNALEIVSKDGALAVSLNGTPISRSEPNFLSEGLIGIQAEDHPFEVRRMRIRPE